MGENNFSRDLRLLSPAHFENVFKKATPAVSPQLTVLAKPNKTGHPRLGITISKKRVKHAYQRNRIKRIIRESFRQQSILPSVDIVVVGKSGLDKLENSQINQALDKLWKKINRRCNT